MTQPTQNTMIKEISDILKQVEQLTRACYEMHPRANPEDLQFKANVFGQSIDMPWNLNLLRNGMSNHAALQFGAKMKAMEGAILQMTDMMRGYLKMPDGRYTPRIELEWFLKRRTAAYNISIDDISLNTKPVSVARLAKTLTAGLLRHADLPMEGESHIYRATNFPTHGRISIDIRAPSEGLAIARIGALVGQNLAQMMEARQNPVSVTRIDADQMMKYEARQALEAIGLIEAQ